MVDFAKEQVIGAKRLAKRLDVSQDTLRRWFRQGLDHQKIGAKVFTTLEALNRFAQSPASQSQVDDEAELAEELQIAARRGM
jgi:transposase-like protein